jgi:O-antigen ligase
MVKKLIYISAALVGLSIPLNTKAANVSIVIFCVLSVFYCYKNSFIKKPQLSLFKFSTVIFFVLAFVGIFLAADKSTAFNHLGRRIFFLLIPLVLCFYDKKHLQSILKFSLIGLIGGCVLSGMFLLFQTLQNYFSDRLLTQVGFDLFNYYHTYHNFTAPLKFHPTYLGSYFYLSIMSILYFLTKKPSKLLWAVSVLVVLFLILIEFFINSRVILFLLILSLTLFFLWFLKVQFQKNRLYFFTYIIAFFIVIITAFSFVKNTYIYYRFTNELSWEASKNVDSKINKDNGGDSRLARWSSIVEVIKEKPLLGYGTGNEKEVLKAQFQKDNLKFSSENNYDSHNLYLSYSVQFGLLGFLILSFFIISNLIFSFQKKNILFFSLILGLMLVLFFENFLNNNAGIVFIAFFQNLLMFYSLKRT